jgi:DNA-directed RNA polymerase specialized sigma24 family protein
MSSHGSASEAPRSFPNTRWSVVLAATQKQSPDSAAALEAICRAYWYPLYAYVRRCGQSPHDAQDLTQEFFCRLLEKHWLDSADPNKGKLRTFLIVMLKHFMRYSTSSGH